jgi:diguanylate cyclase
MEDGARLAGIAIERHRALEQLIYGARHDGLTGLPNRTAIFGVIDEAIVRVSPGSAAAVLFIDLDGLKTLNDTLGHDRADDMIREVAERLSTAVRGSDFVGRFGGDEFVVVAEGVADEAQAASLGFRLLEAISRPLPGIDTTVATASIGITLVTDPQSDGREALRQADTAMYEAKRSGRDRLSFFGGSRRSHEGRRLALVRELRGAEKRGELGIVFQPVFELGELSGAGPRRHDRRANSARPRIGRNPHRARRFRHRVLVAVLAQGASGGRDQDRPQLRLWAGRGLA